METDGGLQPWGIKGARNGQVERLSGMTGYGAIEGTAYRVEVDTHYPVVVVCTMAR